MKKEVSHYLEQGHWFLSLYNDDGDPQEVTFMSAVSEDMTVNCPNGCSGKGECMLGHCQCKPGFGGEDCSESKMIFSNTFICYCFILFLFFCNLKLLSTKDRNLKNGCFF